MQILGTFSANLDTSSAELDTSNLECEKGMPKSRRIVMQSKQKIGYTACISISRLNFETFLNKGCQNPSNFGQFC